MIGAASRDCAIQFARGVLGEIVPQDALEKWIAKWVMCDFVRVDDALLKQSVVTTHVVAVLLGRASDRVVDLTL